MVFYIAVIIFHNQHESNYISMVFYIAVIIYDSVIISLTYCFLNISIFVFLNLLDQILAIFRALRRPLLTAIIFLNFF
jgi:hypothetical protein